MRPVLINMDETSVTMTPAEPRGNIVKIRRRHGGSRPTASIGRKHARTCLTHAAFLTPDRDIQALLPQFLIINCPMMTLATLARVRETLPPNVIIVRQKSAWVNHETLGVMFAEIRRRLTPHPAVQPILLMDTAPQHLGDEVASHARTSRIWLSLVPPSLTWLLQPLDVRVFYKYKRLLAKLFLHERVRAPDGIVSTETWIANICKVSAKVIDEPDWRQTFNETGWLLNQSHVSAFILDRLGVQTLPPLSAEVPFHDAMRSLLPGKVKNAFLTWLRNQGPAPVDALEPVAPALPEPRTTPRFRIPARYSAAAVSARGLCLRAAHPM